MHGRRGNDVPPVPARIDPSAESHDAGRKFSGGAEVEVPALAGDHFDSRRQRTVRCLQYLQGLLTERTIDIENRESSLAPRCKAYVLLGPPLHQLSTTAKSVVASRTPELAACRTMQKRGLAGRVEFFWARVPDPGLIVPDLAKGARLRVIAEDRRGPALEEWRPPKMCRPPGSTRPAGRGQRPGSRGPDNVNQAPAQGKVLPFSRRGMAGNALRRSGLAALCLNNGVQIRLISCAATAPLEDSTLLNGKRHVMNVAFHLGG